MSYEHWAISNAKQSDGAIIDSYLAMHLKDA